MSGIPPGYVPVQQYAQPSQPAAPYPQQQVYAAPPVQYAQQPQPAGQTDIGELIRTHAKEVSDLKRLQRQKKRLLNAQNEPAMPQYQPVPEGGSGSMVIGAAEEDEYSQFDSLETEELEKMRGRVRGEARTVIDEILNDREYSDELDSLESLGDEIDDLTFHAVKYAEGSSAEWILAYTQIDMDGVDSMMARLRRDYPRATRVKWGVVKKAKKTIDSLSGRGFSIRSDSAARLAIPEASVPQPQQNGMQGIADVMRVVQESSAASQNAIVQLMSVMREDKTAPKNPMEEMIALKTAFLDPQMAMQVEMFKAMNPKGQGMDGMAISKMIIDGAQTLSKGNSGGGDSGIMGVIREIGPVLLDAFQKLQPPQGNGQHQTQQPTDPQEDLPTQQKALPGPAQENKKQMNQLHAKLQEVCRRIVKHLLGNKLQLEQVPRYIYKNFEPEVCQPITEMDHEQFRAVISSSVGQDQTLKAFVSNPKVHEGMQWIHEEFCRLVMGLSILDVQGSAEEIKERLEYSAEPFIETELVGEEARKAFFERYSITREDLVSIGVLSEEEEEEQEDMPATAAPPQEQQEPQENLPQTAPAPQSQAPPPQPQKKVHQATIVSRPRKKVKKKSMSFKTPQPEKVAGQ